METVNILIEALPYIKKFHNKKILIKYGGHAMIDEGA
ncbi:MAG: acetylglutamate kinase, partial [Methanobacterium sp.]